ncbi:MAG: SDR family NAD(P)-dependent oxidoreductase [Nannocystaceae bacterium]
MANELRYDGKVAIITGAGNGLGRSHALLLASRGARVVVNDLGGDAHGGGKGSKAADAVVAAIKEAGGEAIANYDSVEDGAKIVQCALDSFGRVDIVVNNAGILRDTTFHKMSEQDWELIYRVHVLGAFRVTHAAWPHMRDQGFGRVIMTASAAGIYGNFGQANYAMAKLGLVGMSNTLALEGKKRGVHVNAIAPIAGSRMTETVMPPELIAALRPEAVSPLVAWLCHEDCEETGGLFEVGGGFFSKLRWERSQGVTVRIGRDIRPEDLQRRWKEVTDFEGATHPAEITQALGPVIANVNAGPSKGGNQFIDVDLALGHEGAPIRSEYTQHDLALYALGVGATAADPLDPVELRYVYEMHQDGFVPLPTYGVIPGINAVLDEAKKGSLAPGLNFGLDRLLHGEQYTELRRPLPPAAKLTHRVKVKDIFDKGKHATVVFAISTTDESGEELVYNELTALIRGAGGWGGDRGPQGEQNVPPEREPDATVEEVISPNQALLYRLSGDWNPLHADPNFARAFGFDRPILHGLCTFGYAGRAILRELNDDPRKFKSIKVRFAESVFPGETLVTEMWVESPTRVIFRAKVKGRDKVVISHAAVELFAVIPEPKKAAPKPAASAAAPAQSAEPNSADVFAAITDYVAKNADAKKIGVIYQFKITDPASVWTIDLKSGSVGAGQTAAPECTLEITEADFMAMCTGKANAQDLYFGGKLKISGNVMASQKLTFLQKLDPAAVERAMKARLAGGGAAPAAAQAEAAAPSGPGAAEVFGALRRRLGDNPGLAAEVDALVAFVVRSPESQWTVSLRGEHLEVVEGGAVDATATFTLGEADLVALARGETTAQSLYQRGLLRVDGDVRIAHRLGFLNKLV